MSVMTITNETRKSIVGFVTALPAIDGFKALALRNGERCFRQGDEDDRVGVVLSGHLILSRVTARGDAAVSGILFPGDVFGIGEVERRSRTDSATAKGPTRVALAGARQFWGLLRDHPAFALHCVELLAERERLTQRRLQAALTLDLRGRIAVVLGDLVSEHGEKCRHGHDIDVSLTQQQLADLIGASRPAVSAELNALRRDGLLGYTRDHICLNDLPALQTLAAELSSG